MHFGEYAELTNQNEKEKEVLSNKELSIWSLQQYSKSLLIVVTRKDRWWGGFIECVCGNSGKEW